MINHLQEMLENALTVKQFEFSRVPNPDGTVAYQVVLGRAPANNVGREHFLAGVALLPNGNWGIIFDVCISDKPVDNFNHVITYLQQAKDRYQETHKWVNCTSAGLLPIYWDVETDQTFGTAALRGFVTGNLAPIDIITVLNYFRSTIAPSMVVSKGGNVYINV